MHNLTLTPTSFIGRSQEIAEISSLLDDPSCRLLTLVGPGGIGCLKGILQAMFKLAQTTLLKGDLEDARTLAEHMRDLADETSNLDGKMLLAGLLAFLICVMHEAYTKGAALAQQNQAITRESFFGGHNVS